MRKLLIIILWITIFGKLSYTQDYLFFTNSDNPNYYDPSYLYSNTPSTLLKINSVKFPVSVDTFYSSTNALKLQWKSMTAGDWGSAIAAPGWPGRDFTIMDSISIWVYSAQTIDSLSLPKIYLEDLSNQKTAKINISNFQGDINPGEWTNLKIPVSVFISNPGSADLTRIKVIYFGQGVSDATLHTMFVDDVKVTGNFNPNLYKHIVVLGSSTAAGTGTTNPDSAWVNRFRNYFVAQDSSFRVINLAVGGYTTYHIMPTGFVPINGRPNPSVYNNITYALTYNPVAVLINMPSNDAANSFPMIEQIANYDTLVKILNEQSIPFWMSTTQPRNFSNQSQLNLLFAMRDSTYSRYANNAVDFWTNLAQVNGWINPIYNSGDGIHLNNAAHRILFERMKDAVTPDILDVDDKSYVSEEVSFKLNNNYPNPFNPSTTISFYTPKRAKVKVDVLNVLGEFVTNLLSADLESGNHSVKFNADDLSSGVYICRVLVINADNENYITSNKMMLVK